MRPLKTEMPGDDIVNELAARRKCPLMWRTETGDVPGGCSGRQRHTEPCAGAQLVKLVKLVREKMGFYESEAWHGRGWVVAGGRLVESGAVSAGAF